MKLSILKKLARMKQEKIVTKILTEYYEEEGDVDDQTIDILNGMLDNLEITDRDQVMSTIVFAEQYAKLNIKEPSPIKYEKAKDKDSGDADVVDTAGAGSTASGPTTQTESNDTKN